MGELIFSEEPFWVFNKKTEITLLIKEHYKKINKLMNLSPVTKHVHIDASNISEYMDVIMDKIDNNCFAISLEENGLLYMGSFFNHSCDPNVIYYYLNGKMHFVAYKNVKVGEELCISYTEFSRTTDYIQRGKKLKNWNFSCRCQKCKDEILQSINNCIGSYRRLYDDTTVVDFVPKIYELFLS
jgi:hypothetical protein